MLVLSAIFMGAGCAQSAAQWPADASFRNVMAGREEQLNNPGHVVLIFITNDCPISNSYAPEINRIVDAFQGSAMAFYLVHVDRSLSGDDAQKHARDFGYRCPVILDPQHHLVHAAGATVTPEAAVLDDRWQLVYRGRIDDQYVDFGKKRFAPTTHDLRDALEAIRSGKPPPESRTRAIGCYISDT